MNRSVLFVFGERRVVFNVVVVTVDNCAWVEPGRAVLELQAHAHELGLNLIDRLRPEVTDIEQVSLTASEKLAHGVNALTLEAVVGPHGQVEVLDRKSKISCECGIGGRGAHVDALGLDVELAGQAEELDQGLPGGRHGVTGSTRALGLHVNDELVEVGALLDSRGLDLVGHGQYGRVDRVDRDATDLGVTGLVLLGGDVAATAFDGQLHLELALAVQGRDVEVRVVHLDTCRRRDVRGGNRTRALLAQVHHDRLVVLAGDDQTLDVQDDLGDVFLDTGDRRELMQHAVDTQARHGRTGDAREQSATKGVAEGVAEAGFEGLDDEPRTGVGDDVFAQGGALCNL